MAVMMRAMMGGMLILVLPAFLIFLGVAVITYRRRVGPGSGEAGGDGWDGGRGEGGEGGGGGWGGGGGGGGGAGGGGGGGGGRLGRPGSAPGAAAGRPAAPQARRGTSLRGRRGWRRGSGAASTGLRKSRIVAIFHAGGAVAKW